MDLHEENRTYHEAQGAMALLPNYFAWTYGALRRFVSGVVLELGCGAGLGIAHYAAHATSIIAVDHDPKLLAQVARLELAVPLETLAADLTDDWSALAHIEADTIIMMDVLEHFQDDGAFIARAAERLAQGGRLVIKVPAQSRLYSNVDRASGHYRRYDGPDLERLAAGAGMRIASLRHINPVGALVYRLRGRRRSNFSRTFSPTQLTLINAAMPVLRLGDLIPLLPGLSLICVMEHAD